MNASAIHTAVVEVRYADPPREGKKQATIKTPAGDIYGMKPELLGLFRRGNRYRVDYTERAYQGRTFRTIVKVEPEERTGDCTAAPGQRSPDTNSSLSPGESEFVTRCLAASIASCSIGATEEDILRRLVMLRQVWRRGMVS